MSAPQHPFGPDPVAEKVLRRVEVAKVARNLQDCLAFASFKAQNGWQNRTLRTIEPEVTEQLKRKRPHSSDDIMSDSSSSTDELHGPAFSMNAFGRPSSHAELSSFKAPQNPNKRVRAASSLGEIKAPNGLSWKQSYQQPQSSPVFNRPHTSIGQSYSSFMSDTTAIPDSHPQSSPLFDMSHATDEEDTDLPMHSFQHPPSSSIISSSPPRTPPPTRRNRNDNSKQDGADLLLYLANSPSRSPAVGPTRVTVSSQEPPSTPPSQHSHLPSSVMNTPGIGLFNGALQTPGQNFNFADFVNVTPSPAQIPWGGRTPGNPKNTSAARIARRGINFDALVPPTGSSPNMQRRAPTSKGLALELGEELLPRS